MPSRAEITAFDDPPVPMGCSPWVSGAEPSREIDIVEPDATWPARYDELAARIFNALGWRALVVEHVGSTSVPAKPATYLTNEQEGALQTRKTIVVWDFVAPVLLWRYEHSGVARVTTRRV